MVIGEWIEAGNQPMAVSLARFAADIDLLSQDERAEASEIMFGAPGRRKPVGILSAKETCGICDVLSDIELAHQLRTVASHEPFWAAPLLAAARRLEARNS